MFNFIGFLFSLLKGIYYTCAIHTQVNRQASVVRILFAGFFGIFSSSINKILLDAQIKEYNTKISTRQNTYDEEHNNIEITPTAPQLPPLPQNHPLSLVPRNFRNLAITNNPNSRPKTTQSPIQHIMTHHSQNDNTYEQIIEQPHTTTFQSQHNHFLAQIPIIPLFAFSPPDFPIINISSSTNSDTNSDISVLHSISQFNNSNVETPDELADSEPSPSTYTQTNPSVFSKPPFQPIPSNHPLPSVSTPSYASQVTPAYSPLHSDRSYNYSPDTPQIFQELDNFITLQQQLLHPNTLTIHQLSSTITSSNPPTPTPSSAYTPSLAQSSTSTETTTSTHRAYRTLKRNFPNHPFPTKPGTAREYINHPQHTNTKIFREITLPSFPHYTLNTPNDTKDTRSFVDEHVLMPTLHWTAYYHFTNPLCLPLTNTHDRIEKNKDMLYRLTTTLTPRQFTYVGYKKLLKTFTATRANEFTIENYDHNIIRPNQDQFLDEDRFANPQLTEKVFIKISTLFSDLIFLIESMTTLFQNH